MSELIQNCKIMFSFLAAGGVLLIMLDHHVVYLSSDFEANDSSLMLGCSASRTGCRSSLEAH